MDSLNPTSRVHMHMRCSWSGGHHQAHQGPSLTIRPGLRGCRGRERDRNRVRSQCHSEEVQVEKVGEGRKTNRVWNGVVEGCSI
jgi:hypothetical protein